MDTSYLPVSWDFREAIDEARAQQKDSLIHYFDEKDNILSSKGKISDVVEIKGEGEFLVLENGDKLRLDMIITLYGRPGSAFDKYDAYANACLSCTGGYGKFDF
jgi:hypothetical protein